MAVAKTFERALKFLVPSWLSAGEGGKALVAVTRVLDENVARGRAALEARFPSRAQDDALALIGEDRGIIRGRDEPRDRYIQRLVAWRYPRGHRTRGSAFALLEQVSEYFGRILCWTVDVNRTLHLRDETGVEQTFYGVAWDWDGTTMPKGRFWIVLSVPAGFTYTLGDVEAIRGLFRGGIKWNPAGTQPEWVMVRAIGSGPVTDGHWLTWSRNIAGTQTATRDNTMRYWSLAPARNNTYAGNAASYATQFPSMVSGMKAGNPASYPATITLTTGIAYGGNPFSYPAKLQLVDDGETLV